MERPVTFGPVLLGVSSGAIWAGIWFGNTPTGRQAKAGAGACGFRRFVPAICDRSVSPSSKSRTGSRPLKPAVNFTGPVAVRPVSSSALRPVDDFP